MNYFTAKRHTAWPTIVSVVLSLALLSSGMTFVASRAFAAAGGPTVTLSSTSGASTNVSPIPISATYSESVGAIDSSKIMVTNGSVGTITKVGNTFSFGVTPTTQGTVTVMIDADAVSSTASSTGSQASNTLTFTYDTTDPTVTREITPTATGATITWTTSEPAKGRVNYGLTDSYGSSTALESSFTTSHTATITGLTPNTTYHYEVTATDAAGNDGTTGDLAFTTLADTGGGGDTTAPTITRELISNPNGASVTWTTSEPARGQISYGLTSSYTSSTTMETAFTTSHAATITGLTPNTTYHYAITATDAAGNTGTTGDLAFTTPSATSTPATPVISNVNATNLCQTGATITWNTNVAANSQVFFGTTTALGSSTTLDPATGTSHSVNLTSLNGSTLYYYMVSTSNGSSTATSTQQSFNTTSVACPTSTTTLAVTGIDSISTIASPDNTFANGWKWIMHVTVPDNERAFRMKFGDFTNGAGGTIPANGNIRISTPQGSNASTTSSGTISSGNNYGEWIILTGDTSSTTPGRQIDVTIEVKVPVGTPTGTYSTTFGAQSVPSTATSTTP